MSLRSVIATSKPPSAVSTDLDTIEREIIAQCFVRAVEFRRGPRDVSTSRTQLYRRMQKEALERQP